MTRLYRSNITWKDPDDRPAPWRRAEMFLCEEFDLTEEHASSHDAREADGTKVELKSTVDFRENGQVGQFEIWLSQLDDLMPDGKVGLLVHSPEYRHVVIGTRLVRARDLRYRGEFVSYPHPTMGIEPRRLIEWPSVIPLDETFFYHRRMYLDLYDQEEVEDAILPTPPSPTSDE